MSGGIWIKVSVELTKLSFDINEVEPEKTNHVCHIEILGAQMVYENNAIKASEATMDIMLTLEGLNVKDPSKNRL